jgi:hypothetical protein
VQLLPQNAPGTFPPAVTVTPKAIDLRENVIKLPKDGRGGDLLVLVDNARECALWFCVKSGGDDPAEWAPVLLGPRVKGVG